jgi:carbonic anhydrase
MTGQDRIILLSSHERYSVLTSVDKLQENIIVPNRVKILFQPQTLGNLSLAIKIKGFDQITAGISGVALSGLLFTGIWYLGKCSATRELEAESQRFEQTEKDLKHLEEASSKKMLSSAEDLPSHNATENLNVRASVETMEHWGYSGNLAPWYWAHLNERWKACASKINQSPVDISGAREDEGLKALKFNYFHGVTKLTFHHQTVQGDVERGSWLDWNGERFDLTKIYFRTPSEHRVNSLPWEMEVQLEHQAVTGSKIMVSVLITPGKSQDLLTRISENLPRVKDEIRDIDRLNWIDLMPSKRTYWTYVGSSTTPPCDPDVRWIILNTPQTSSKSSIDRLVMMQKANTRPISLLGKRPLSRSNR